MVSLLEAPSSLRIAITATGSVAEIINPKRREMSQLKSPLLMIIYFITIAVRIAQTRSIGPARMRILTSCFLNMNQSQLNAESKMRGGKKRRRIRFGGI